MNGTASPPARVRFAPSPTGRFHIGGARTALYDFLWARQTSGQFILRIEDTDRKRYVPGAEDELVQALRWLGLEWDEGPDRGGPAGPYRQSERAAIYQAHADLLVQQGSAYPCFCSPERLAQVRQEQQKRHAPPRYDGLCRALSAEDSRRRVGAGEPHVTRFRTPTDGQTTSVDLLRGPIQVENRTLDDYILLKSDGLPVYHLAAMVDDHLMGITHVLRSSEWLPTFPLHVLIFRAFGWAEPVWVHLSVFLNPSGKGKMSKRHAQVAGGAQSIYVTDLETAGYLPEAVVNWIALMGWSLDDHTEFFQLADLVQEFSLERLNPSPAAVNFAKLDHFNGLHIRNLPAEELAKRLLPSFESAGLPAREDRLRALAPLLRERIRTLEEAVDMAGFFFRDDVAPDPEALVGKGLTPEASAAALRGASEAVARLPAWEAESIEATLREQAASQGLEAGQLFGILRVATTGQTVSPPLIETMVILGKDLVLSRLRAALPHLTQPGAAPL
jgi:glutamyl-tRNA synthetase